MRNENYSYQVYILENKHLVCIQTWDSNIWCVFKKKILGFHRPKSIKLNVVFKEDEYGVKKRKSCEKETKQKHRQEVELSYYLYKHTK